MLTHNLPFRGPGLVRRFTHRTPEGRKVTAIRRPRTPDREPSRVRGGSVSVELADDANPDIDQF
jgi:hypothetical protein